MSENFPHYSGLSNKEIHLISSFVSDLGTEEENTHSNSDDDNNNNNKNNWMFLNHDIYGTRNSNQTIIGKDNVDNLQIKWRLNNTLEIQDPPLIVGDKGFVQDYGGNIISFSANDGNVIWRTETGGGPTMGLAFNNNTIFASTATNSTIVSINATDGSIIWRSEELGESELGYSIDASPLVWKDYVIAGSGGSGLLQVLEQ